MTKQASQRPLCPGCGSSVPGNDRYCGVCGARLSARAETELLADHHLGVAKSDNLAPSTTHSFQIGQVVEGRYRIVELIGRGGMASVLRVEQIHLKKTLAMKILHENLVVHPAAVARFVREARAISKLENGHTVRLFDFGKLGDVFYLVMEYIEGRDLESLLHEVGRLSPARVLDIVVQICESLEEAHSQGIVHRDLKPENIMLVKQKEIGDMDYVKVLDFGLAQMHEGDEAVTHHSRAALFGTPYYMAPEQIRGEKIDGRTDLYALGAVGYRMLTGRCPFVARATFDVLAQHLDGSVPAFSEACPNLDVDPELERIVIRCLAKLPDDRFMSANSLRKSLLALRSDSGLATVDTGTQNVQAEVHTAEDESATSGVVSVDSVPPGPKLRAPTATRVVEDVDLDDDDPETIRYTGSWFSRFRLLTPDVADPPSTDEDEVGIDSATTEENQRTRRQYKMWIGGAALVLVVGIVTIWLLSGAGERADDPGKEQEPNDSTEQATKATFGMDIEGSLDHNKDTEKPDADFFRVSGAGADTRYDIYVDSTANVDFALRIHGSNGQRVQELNHRGVGHGEWVTRLAPPKGESWWVEVYPRKQAGVSDSGLYRLRINPRKAGDNEESEPNHSRELATVVAADKPISARTDGPFDIDWFRIDGLPEEPRLWNVAISGGGAIVRTVRLWTADLRPQLEWRVGGDGKVAVVASEAGSGLGYVEVHCGQGQRCTGDYVLTLGRSETTQIRETEPNATFAEATDVVLGQRVEGSLTERDDVDVFRVPIRGTGQKFHVILHSEGGRRIDIHVCGEGCTSPTVVSLKPGREPGAAQPIVFLAKEKDDAVYVRLSGEAPRRVENYVLRVIPAYDVR